MESKKSQSPDYRHMAEIGNQLCISNMPVLWGKVDYEVLEKGDLLVRVDGSVLKSSNIADIVVSSDR